MPPTIITLLDFSAFSSAWYWLLVALIWTRLIYAPLGLPTDLVRRADHGDDCAAQDIHALARVELRSRADAARVLGHWRVALWAFALTMLLLLAALYQVETAQALFLVAAPLAVVQWQSGRSRRRIIDAGMQGCDLHRELRKLGHRVQAVGLVSVFLSAVWGMYCLLAAQSV